MSDTFAEFVSMRSPHLLRTAYLLTHDWATAEVLLQSSLIRAWSAWNRIDGDPEPYVRRIMVNTYSSWWRRKWRAEQPHAELPEHTGEDPFRTVDARDEVWRALDRLPRRQRAVLVLRYFEDLPEAEIADVLGVKPGTVKSQAAKALAKLRGVPGLFPETPGLDHLRLAQVRQRISKRRTRRIVAAAGAVLLFLSGYALSTAASGKNPPDPGRPSPSPSVSARPEFDNGRRTVATGLSAPGGALTVTLTWTPVKDSHTITVNCRAGDLGVTGGRAATRVNGNPSPSTRSPAGRRLLRR
ncbi:SigE family RNA polymerase sigma factor [Catelliglobosispora koreensis]|uniref:SigE family RNA polymerase sigma factor n=1 Tax=Catelliglobosispora koreensis TaxID=129052 RepID=UPI00039F4E7B|nr:SigE family RNA polymerase sigma factor [Catelliglobosispora koreensis]